jgi:hypothetical protein
MRASGRALLLFLSTLLLACEGKQGPVGPAGPTGPQGQPGLPGPAGANGTTRVVLTSVIKADGSASVALPTAAGTDVNRPPAMSCYIGNSAFAVWLSVAGSPSEDDPYCGLVFDRGTFFAFMDGAPPGWIAAFVVIY